MGNIARVWELIHSCKILVRNTENKRPLEINRGRWRRLMLKWIVRNWIW
jgi:hypothetical protein